MFITKKQFYDLVPPKGWDEIYKEMITTHEKILLRYFSCVKFGGFERPALYMIDRETFTNDQGGLFRYVICRYYMEKIVPHCSKIEVLFTYDKKGECNIDSLLDFFESSWKYFIEYHSDFVNFVTNKV